MGDKETSQSEALANYGPLEAPSSWRANLRTRVVKHGIRLVCGTPDFVPATAANDVPLINAGLRLGSGSAPAWCSDSPRRHNAAKRRIRGR